MNLTDQVMFAVPDINKKTPVASEEKAYIADIPVGCIALLFGQMGAIKNKAYGINQENVSDQIPLIWQWI